MNTQNSLVIARPNNGLSSLDEIERAASSLAKSGYFIDARDVAQCVTKILAGRELGFGPFASMTGIHIIQGRPAIGANLMAAAVKGSGRYNYRVTEMSDKTCSIKFYEHGEEIGISTFTMEDAKKAQTKNLDKFPRNMLFARAMSNGVRWFCPDVFSGSPVYTPEELGAEVDGDGNVINGHFQDAPAEPERKKTEPMEGQYEDAPDMVSEAEALGGELVDEAPAIPEAVKAAMEVKTKKGARLADLNDSQLETLTTVKDNEALKKAATTLLNWRIDQKIQF
jgi:hypothetical protein